jgi:hypothetical protein
MRIQPVLCAGLLILIGCGNNSGAGSNTAGGGTNYAGQAQGVYIGTVSNGDAFESIVLPDDKFYALYGTAMAVYGMMSGQGNSGNNTYTAAIEEFTGGGSAMQGSVTATDVPGSSVNGMITAAGTTLSFSGTAPASSLFNYNGQASVGSIAGTWYGSLMDGSFATVTITSSGAVSGSDGGCSFSGTVSPDPSGKNFFNVSLSFGGSPCLFPNQTATGVGIYYLLPDGMTQQLLAGVTVGTSEGTAFFAQR